MGIQLSITYKFDNFNQFIEKYNTLPRKFAEHMLNESKFKVGYITGSPLDAIVLVINNDNTIIFLRLREHGKCINASSYGISMEKANAIWNKFIIYDSEDHESDCLCHIPLDIFGQCISKEANATVNDIYNVNNVCNLTAFSLLER